MRNTIVSLLAFLAFLTVTTTGCQAQNEQATPKHTPPQQQEQKSVDKEIAVIETEHGTIEIEFYRDAAPKTVENFVQLAKRGYYNGVIFHRVIKGFMIQGGDPTGTGYNGESIYGKRFDDEINTDLQIYKDGYKRGTVAMANAGPNTNGSQFFIMHRDYDLAKNYTIFGRVVSGMETVDAIANLPVGEGNRPKTAATMLKVTMK